MYGEVEFDTNGNPICEECGKSFKKLLAHVWQKHNLSGKEYKIKHGLELLKGIQCRETKELCRRRLLENYDKVVLENLVTKGANTRFKKGQGRSKYTSEQTKRKLRVHLKGINSRNKLEKL